MYRVISNDVQSYSAVIARSLIGHSPKTRDDFLAAVDPEADLARAYQENYDRLARYYEAALELEADFLKTYEAGRADDSWSVGYREYLRTAAELYPGVGSGSIAEPFRSAEPLLRARAGAGDSPACLATTYYSNVYFGLRQSLQIDSLRAAIEALDERDPWRESKRTHYLSALLHAASVSTSGTSHFAQPRHLAKDTELQAMAGRRLTDIRDSLVEYSAAIAQTVRETVFAEGNQVFNSDYRELLDEDGVFELPEGPGLVYLDPPYTADNYSRFYHVLEVLTRYDYPELKRGRSGELLRGRYPVLAHRFRSDFCSPTKVEDEFRMVLGAVSGSGAKLVISYSSPTGLLLKEFSRQGSSEPLDRLRRMCGEFYESVEILKRPMMHSGQGDSNIAIDELLVVCGRPHSRSRAW
jgi:adenine-specific DNA methylase